MCHTKIWAYHMYNPDCGVLVENCVTFMLQPLPDRSWEALAPYLKHPIHSTRKASSSSRISMHVGEACWI